MTLTDGQVVIFSALAGLVLLHLVYDMIKTGSFAGFFNFSLLALFLALFLMEALFLKIPFLDFILAVALGVLAGLHVLSVFSRKRR